MKGVATAEQPRMDALHQVKKLLDEEDLARVKAIRATLTGLANRELARAFADLLVLLGSQSTRAAAFEENVSRLLPLIGDSSQCAGADCGERIWWVRTRQKRKLCLDQDGRAHWATCPNADDFRRRAAAKAQGRSGAEP